MPSYDIKCTSCKWKGHDYHKMSEPHCPCPKCGKKTETDIGRQGFPRLGNREFHGQGRNSFQWSFCEDEVAEARRDFAGTGATITDEGDVLFDNRSQERAFRGRIKQMRRKTAEQEQAKETKAAEDRRRGREPKTPKTPTSV